MTDELPQSASGHIVGPSKGKYFMVSVKDMVKKFRWSRTKTVDRTT